MNLHPLTRRAALGLIAGTVAAAAAGASTPVAPSSASPMATRKAPSSGEAVPVIGMGSSNTFDVPDGDAGMPALREVLATLAAAGGRVIDSSPMYGRAESVLGRLMDDAAPSPPWWLATKVWTRGREAGVQQIEQSFERLRTKRLDLLQIHNLLDWREHLPALRALVEAGRVRHVGITHYRADAHAELERVLRAERFDWLQVNYSLGEREADARLLPFCREQGIAVMVNRPFADGALFERVRGRPLPPLAAELGCTSWAQYFLKWIVSNPAVTCVIPATSKPRHMLDNVAAGRGPMPDERQRAQMLEAFEAP